MTNQAGRSDRPTTHERPPSTPKRTKRIVAAVVAIVVLVVGGILGYRQFILADAEPPLVLGQRSEQANDQPPARPDVTTATNMTDVLQSSTWTTTGDSIVDYRVDEAVAGVLDETVTGRTNAVNGTITIRNSQLIEATFDVDMTTLDSGSTARDAALQRSQLATNDYPTATFTLTDPVTLDNATEVNVIATGNLTLRGRTAVVEAEISARIIDNELQVLGTTPVDLDTYDIDLNPPGVTIENTQTEFSLVLRISDT